MDPQEKARLRLALLQALRAIGATGLDERALLNAVRLAGFDVALPALQVELRALADENLTAPFVPLTGKRYRLTALGESMLAEAGV